MSYLLFFLLMGGIDSELCPEITDEINSLEFEIKPDDHCIKMVNLPDQNNSDGYIFWIFTAGLSIATIIAMYAIARHTVTGTIEENHDHVQNNTTKLVVQTIIELCDSLIPDTSYTDTATGQKVSYLNKGINTNSFDSIISSGSFIYLDSNLRKRYDELYFQISEHNRLVQKLEDVSLQARMDPALTGTFKIIFELVFSFHMYEHWIITNALPNVVDALKNNLESIQ